jgi:hypothetical protein
MTGHWKQEASRYMRGGPSRRWGRWIDWAVKGTGGKPPRHKKAVLYLAVRALELELKLWVWTR